eukprot:scaffold125544_cov26-Tisochrysis_lutea.AAC.1
MGRSGSGNLLNQALETPPRAKRASSAFRCVGGVTSGGGYDWRLQMCVRCGKEKSSKNEVYASQKSCTHEGGVALRRRLFCCVVRGSSAAYSNCKIKHQPPAFAVRVTSLPHPFPRSWPALRRGPPQGMVPCKRM